MLKEEFRAYVKQKFKGMGFQSRKSINYKFIEDDYIVCLDLDPSSYCRGYQCSAGALLLPTTAYPPYGYYHMSSTFSFPRDPSYKLDFSLPWREQHLKYFSICEYEMYTVEQIEEFFDMNIENFLKPLYNKEFFFDHFRKDWRMFNFFDPRDIVNICKKAGIDAKEVFNFLGIDHFERWFERLDINAEEFLASL